MPGENCMIRLVKRLAPFDSYKYLGVVVDNKLNWKENSQNINKKKEITIQTVLFKEALIF